MCDTVRPAKPKYLLFDPLQKRSANLCIRAISLDCWGKKANYSCLQNEMGVEKLEVANIDNSSTDT